MAYNTGMKTSPSSDLPKEAVRKPSKAELQRAIASSTAIETGESTEILERRMRERELEARELGLAP